MNYWLLKSEPDVWSINHQKNQAQMELYGMEFEIIRQLKI